MVQRRFDSGLIELAEACVDGFERIQPGIDDTRQRCGLIGAKQTP